MSSPPGEIICHGDFHPGNVLLSDRGPILIDWTGATRGDLTADFARTRLMLQVGELPPGVPAAIRALAAVGRRTLWKLYERNYRRASSIRLDLVDRWTIVVAANRLTEAVESETLSPAGHSPQARWLSEPEARGHSTKNRASPHAGIPHQAMAERHNGDTSTTRDRAVSGEMHRSPSPVSSQRPQQMEYGATQSPMPSGVGWEAVLADGSNRHPQSFPGRRKDLRV